MITRTGWLVDTCWWLLLPARLPARLPACLAQQQCAPVWPWHPLRA